MFLFFLFYYFFKNKNDTKAAPAEADKSQQVNNQEQPNTQQQAGLSPGSEQKHRVDQVGNSAAGNPNEQIPDPAFAQAESAAQQLADSAAQQLADSAAQQLADSAAHQLADSAAQQLADSAAQQLAEPAAQLEATSNAVEPEAEQEAAVGGNKVEQKATDSSKKPSLDELPADTVSSATADAVSTAGYFLFSSSLIN